jgi:hypothetical protein
MSDFAAIRARFEELYPEAAHEPEVKRATGSALGALSCAVARYDRAAAMRIYAAALRKHAPFALRLSPRFAASVVLGPLLLRRRRLQSP